MFYCSNCNNIYDISNIPENVTEKKIINKSVYNDYFICNTCNNNDIIVPGTLLLVKTDNINLLKHVNSDIKINNPTLLQTRNYICPNEKCETHKFPELRHANMERISHDSYKIRYICKICKIEWITH